MNLKRSIIVSQPNLSLELPIRLSIILLVILSLFFTSWVGPKTFFASTHLDSFSLTGNNPSSDPAELHLVSATFFGGGGDQRGTAISVHDGAAYLSGNVQPENQGILGDKALVLKYDTSSLMSPVWSRLWSFGNFVGISSTGEGVYAVGSSHPSSGSGTRDGVGGTENKSILAKFSVDGTSGTAPGGALVVGTPNFFSYTGTELHTAAVSSVESGSDFLYVAGGGQPCSHFAYILAKYDASGSLVHAATDSSVGVNFSSCFVPSAGGSNAFGVTTLNGNVYLVGSTNWPHEGDSNGRPAIWKYSPALNLIWRRKNASLAGIFNAVTAFEGAIYGVGTSITPGTANSEDFLIEKYSEAGDRVWSRTSGGSVTDVLTGVIGIGSRLFAVGYTKSSGAGGADVVIIEIDSVNGNTLSTTLFGGAHDDIANGVATDGSDLFVVGESQSFASTEGNVVGQNDVMLLRYATESVGCEASDDTPPTVTVNAPTNSKYFFNQSVAANYACVDACSGVAACTGSVPNGSNIDTASVGTKSFTVSSIDNAGNSSHQSVSYVVTYDSKALFDQTKAVRSGSVIPIKVQLTDALGQNVSSVEVTLHASGLFQVATSAAEVVDDAGSSNADLNFRFDSNIGHTGGYIFNLKTTGLTTGTYRLEFVADGDQTRHSVLFQIRQ